MNEFEKQIRELRRQHKAEQSMITKETYRRIGRLNMAISAVDSDVAREALRNAREQEFASMRSSHRLSKAYYLEQLKLINEAQRRQYEVIPSRHGIRRMIEKICNAVENSGQTTLTISFGDHRRATVTFA